MVTKLRAIGNSTGVVLKKEILRKSGIEKGSVKITAFPGRIVIESHSLKD